MLERIGARFILELYTLLLPRRSDPFHDVIATSSRGLVMSQPLICEAIQALRLERLRTGATEKVGSRNGDRSTVRASAFRSRRFRLDKQPSCHILTIRLLWQLQLNSFWLCDPVSVFSLHFHLTPHTSHQCTRNGIHVLGQLEGNRIFAPAKLDGIPVYNLLAHSQFS